jgi:hypothetical protein
MKKDVDSDSLPFVQVHRRALSLAPLLANAIGCSTQHALGALVQFWALVADPRELKAALEATPEGKEPAITLGLDDLKLRWRLAAGCEAQPEVLEHLGFIERVDDGTRFRVRGLSRYFDAVRRRTALQEAGRRGGSRRQATIKPPLSQTQARGERREERGENTDYVRTYVRDEPSTFSDGSRPAGLALIEAPTTPPETWGAEDFWRWYQFERVDGVEGLPQEKPPHPRKLSAWWAEARAVCSVAQLQAAAHRYGSDPYWRRQVPPVPFAGFAAQWRRYVAEEVRDVG